MKNLDDKTLISMYDSICKEVTKPLFKEVQNKFTGTITGEEFTLPPIKYPSVSFNEFNMVRDRQMELVMELNKRGYISDDELFNFLGLDDLNFCPKITFKQ